MQQYLLRRYAAVFIPYLMIWRNQQATGRQVQHGVASNVSLGIGVTWYLNYLTVMLR
jgi:hypothetical protein